jgi:hypothetical protein
MVRRGALTRAAVRMELPALVAQTRTAGVTEAVVPVVAMIGLGVLDVAIAKELLPRTHTAVV